MVYITVFPTTSHILQSQTGQRIHNKIQSKGPDFQKKSMNYTDSFLGAIGIMYHYLRRQSPFWKIIVDAVKLESCPKVVRFMTFVSHERI